MQTEALDSCPLDSNAAMPAGPLDGRLPLTPALHREARAFLENKNLVFDLVSAFGSPLNIVFPEVAAQNIAGFTDLFAALGLGGRVYFSAKPNKSRAILSEAASANAYVDVSSAGQLRQALCAGFRPEFISATGPKNTEYLSLALRQRVLLIVDHAAELEQIAALRQSLRIAEPVSLMVRLQGLETQADPMTVFGIALEARDDIIALLAANREAFRFVGFAWHARGVSDELRLASIGRCIEATMAAFAAGLKPSALNIGGGYRINYLVDRAEWHRYVSGLKAAALGQRASLSWNNGGLGYRNEGGRIRGAPTFNDHSESVCGAEHLRHILTQPIASIDGMSLADFLREMMLDLYIEPGRAAYDQTGLTLAAVNFRKTAAGEKIVALDLNGSNIGSFWNKLMTDPIVLSQSSHAAPNEEGVFYVGNLCTPNDIVTHHKTYPDIMPGAGDIVAFANTGAYLMDFFESETLLQRVAQKIAVVGQRWYRDEIYDPCRRVTQP